jgi:hypothetical protein
MKLLQKRNVLRDTRWELVEMLADTLNVSTWDINFEGNWKERFQAFYNERAIALTVEIDELEEQIEFMRQLLIEK